ncbi:MAG: hypothetical protein AAF565_20920 [Pseudomonadota bacterium]
MRGAAALMVICAMGSSPSLAVSVDVTAPMPSAADATIAAIEEAAAAGDRQNPTEEAASPTVTQPAPALGGVVPGAGISLPVPASLLLFLAGLAGVVVIHRRPLR